MSTPSQLTTNTDPVSDGKEYIPNTTPSMRDPGHHRLPSIPLKPKGNTSDGRKGKNSHLNGQQTRNKRDNTNGTNRSDVSNIYNFPVKAVVCKNWMIGKCTREQCRFRHDTEPETRSHTGPSRGSMSPLEAAKQDYKVKLVYEKTIRQACLAAQRTLQSRQDALALCKKTHQMNLERENTNYEAFKEREKQRHALALEKAHERHKEIVADVQAACQSSVAASEQALEVAFQTYSERLVEKEIAREGCEVAATEYQQLEALRKQAEASVTEQFAVLRESTLLTCGAGLEVRSVIAGFDTCRITIKDLPSDVNHEDVSEIFTQQGMVHSEFFLLDLRPKEDHQEATVLTDRGRAMAIGLDSFRFRDRILTVKANENLSDSCVLTISWRIPSVTMIATYNSMEEAMTKARDLNGKFCKDQRIKAEMNQPPPVTLKSYIPSSIKLAGFSIGTCIDQEIHDFAGTSNIKSLKSCTLQDIFDRLLQHLKTFPNIKLDSDQLPESIDGRAVVRAQFEDWEEAKKAYESLDKKKLLSNSPVFRASLQDLVRDKIVISQQQYKVQEREWIFLSEKRPESDAYVQTRKGDHGDIYLIQVVGQDKRMVGSLKVRVETMVAGEKLNSSFWHPSFASSSASRKDFFDRVYTEKKVYVRSDFKAKVLKIYGEANAKVEARLMIKEEVDRLAQLETTVTLNQESVSFFMRRGLGQLKELLGEDNVVLKFESGRWKITIKGQDENRHHLRRLIKESLTGVYLEHQKKRELHPCPICTDEISHPEQLDCGHNYCSGCLRHYLTSAPETKMFPLACITCKAPIPIPLIRRFLTPQAFHALVETAFSSYLSNPVRKLKYCRTSDCEQIYHQSEDPRVLRCPSCFSTVCSACGEEAHDGMTCNENKLNKDIDRLFDLWATAHNAQRCPGCEATIEKIDGCNRVTCSQCQTPFCWKCRFSGGDIYTHLNEEHGGVYDYQ